MPLYIQHTATHCNTLQHIATHICHCPTTIRYACGLCYVDIFSASFLFEPPEEGRGVRFPRKLAILADCTTIDVLVSSGLRRDSFHMFPGSRQIPENLDLKTGMYNSNVSIEYTTNTAAHPATAKICIIHCRCIQKKNDF